MLLPCQLEIDYKKRLQSELCKVSSLGWLTAFGIVVEESSGEVNDYNIPAVWMKKKGTKSCGTFDTQAIIG